METNNPVKSSSSNNARRLPWKYEGKKIVIKKSEWNDHVLEIENRLCKDLNRELDSAHASLKKVLDERDALAKENAILRSRMSEARKALNVKDLTAT